MKEKHSESNDGAKCCGFSELLEERRELRRRRNKPQPWIMRKLAVIITIALAIYAHYVYIGRFCVRMIRRDAGAMGSRNMGIAFLVVFLVLAIMFWWTYAMVIFTPPGFATDYVKTKTLPPGSSEDRATPEWWNAHGNYDQYEAHDPSREINGQARPSFRGPDRPNGVHSEKRSEVIRQNGRGDTEAGVLDSIPVKAPKASRPDESEADEPQRRPPDHPQLAPEYWYCSKDQIVKPVRTHHCRACGRCVLQYDHHCPWVGQCVGAHNHKFFYNFVQWSTLWTGWSFATLVARNAKFNIDGQEIAIIVLTGFFTIFTLAMILAHTRLILLNMTTVESLRINDMRAREKNELREITGFFEFRKRRAIKKRWDREWGSLNTEGNIWYQDNLRANWEATMGKSVWGWFLPIGRSESNGLTYPRNPRFDADGRWRRREQWPAELR